MIAGVIVLAATNAVYAQSNNPCVILNNNLYFGDNDSNTGGMVTVLQRFLVQKSYLRATPNGHFGPSTLAAVKAFQAANRIATTGTIGPSTRAGIQDATCGTVTPSPTPYPTPTTTMPPQIDITSPAAGDILTSGSKYQISWNEMPGNTYNILLEDKYGVGAGYIATYKAGGTSFAWNVGEVYSSVTQSDTVAAPGTYRIRIQNVSGASNRDKFSNFFWLKAQPITIRSIYPSELPRDEKTVGVIYGSGFTLNTELVLDNYYGTRANILYRSPDGRALVYTIPKIAFTGSHTLIVSDKYSAATSTSGLMVI